MIELRRNARDVDEGHGLELVHVTRQRAPQRRKLRPLHSRQLPVSELQRGKRRLDVSGERKLLTRQHQHLLDLRQRELVARRRQLAIKRFEGSLLRLRFGQPRLEQRHFRLRVAELVRQIRLGGFCLRQRGIGRRKPLRHLGPQRLALTARIDPHQHAQRSEDQRDDGDRCAGRGWRLRARRARGGRPGGRQSVARRGVPCIHGDGTSSSFAARF